MQQNTLQYVGSAICDSYTAEVVGRLFHNARIVTNRCDFFVYICHQQANWTGTVLYVLYIYTRRIRSHYFSSFHHETDSVMVCVL